MVFVVGAAQARLTVPLAAATVTVVDCAAEPPTPVHVSVYFVVVLSAAVFCEPLMASVPLQPPEAAQEVELVEDQVNVEAAPLARVVGLAVNVTVGAAAVTVTVAVCAAVPPAPVQDSV